MDTSKLRHKKYKMPEGYAFKELIVRETCGHDEQAAARVSSMRGSASDVGTEMVRRSVVAVDGEVVVQPYLQLDGWPSRERQFILKAYEELNAPPPEDIAVFQAASEELTPDALAALTKAPA